MSWLPSFSVEVTHINNVLRANANIPANTINAHTSQLRNMARQVQQMFPRYPLSSIISDLQLSRSIDITIDNILEGRLLPPNRIEFEDDNDDTFTDYTPSTDTTPNSESSSSIVSNSISSLAGDIGYEIERSTNIFGNQNDLLHDDDGYVVPFNRPCKKCIVFIHKSLRVVTFRATEELSLDERFTKSHIEREKILHQRKETMLVLARKR